MTDELMDWKYNVILPQCLKIYKTILDPRKMKENGKTLSAYRDNIEHILGEYDFERSFPTENVNERPMSIYKSEINRGRIWNIHNSNRNIDFALNPSQMMKLPYEVDYIGVDKSLASKIHEDIRNIGI